MKSFFRLSLALLISLSIAACGGRTANPVMIQQYGDDRKSCKAIETELMTIQHEISKLMPETEKAGKNIALGVTGVFFLVPLFFMDLSHAEQEEVNAYRQRYNHLVIIAADKNCGMKVQPIPEFKASEEPKEEKSNSAYPSKQH